jgi:AraC-like DNA-binding protein
VNSGKSQQFPIANIAKVFRFHKPKPPLSNHVDSFWMYEGGETARETERILPTGTLELVINLRQNELSFYTGECPENVSRFSGAIISGAHGRGLVPDNPKEIRLIGVHFKPGGAFPFLGLPAFDLADTHVDLENIWGSSAGRLRDRICEARTSDEKFHFLEQALVKRLHHRVEQHSAVSAALEMFSKHPAAPRVREAAKYVGLSQRRFIQAFKTEVGLTPKLYSRIQRFQRTRSIIHQDPSLDWVTVALDLGYFDQSHLIREFIEFSGRSPTSYLNRQRRIRSILSNTSDG